MKLIIEDDEGRKTVVPIVRDEVEITIGRQDGNTIRLTERNVSRHHAKLTRRLGQVLIEDLNSYNGIKVNGDRINGAHEIKEGDLVQIGDYDLAIEDDEKIQTPVGQSGAAAETALSLLPELADSPDGPTPTPPLRRPTPAQVARLRASPPDTPVDAGRPRRDEADEDEPDGPPPLPDPDRRRPSNGALHAARPAARPAPDDVEEIAAEEAPRLILTTSELAGREFACIRSELTIGRTNDNDIAIDHRSVSQNHCRLVREGDRWKVFDLGSVSGVKINGEPCEEAPLRFGDTLELGHLRFSFLAPGEEQTPPETELSPVAPPAASKVPYLIAVGLIILAILLVAIYFKMRRHSALPQSSTSEAVAEPLAAKAPPTPAPPTEAGQPPQPADPEPADRGSTAAAEGTKPTFQGGRHPEGPQLSQEPVKSLSQGARAEGTPKPSAARPEGGRRSTAAAQAQAAAKEAALRDFEQAESLKRLGRFKEAIPFFQSAIRSDPEMEVAHFDLAVTLAKAGQHGDAAREFQFFADHFPDSPKAEIALTNAREYRQRAPEPAESPGPREGGEHSQRPDM